MSELSEQLPDVAALLRELDGVSYLADEPLGTALFLAARMGQPILLEGEPGVGKTEAAKALAGVLDTPLIRLQCYEGLTSAEALYEWNYPRQLLAIRLAEARGETPSEADLFSDEYLLERPLLAALDHPGPRPAVALIDEVARGARVDKAWHAAALGMLGRLEAILGSSPPAMQVSQAFWHACAAGQRPAAEYLLSRGADLNWEPDYAHGTPLDAATGLGTRQENVLSWLCGLRARSADSDALGRPS